MVLKLDRGPICRWGRWDRVNGVARAVGSGDWIGVGQICGLDEGVGEGFLAEMDSEMIVGLACPGELDPEEMSNCSHKVDIG